MLKIDIPVPGWSWTDGQRASIIAGSSESSTLTTQLLYEIADRLHSWR